MFISCALVVLMGFAQQNSDDLSTRTYVRRVVTLVPNIPPDYSVPLGSIESGTEHTIEIELRNQTGEDLRIAKTRTSCNCMNFRLSAKNIPNNGMTVITATMAVPKHTESITRSATIYASLAGFENPVQIQLKYEMSGIISFVSRVPLVEVGEEDRCAEFKIPLIVSDDIDLKKLSLESGPNSPFESLEFDSAGSGVFVTGTTKDLEPEGDRLAFPILIKSPDGTVVASCDLIVTRHPKLRVSPNTLIFKRTQTDEVGLQRYAATAIARVLEGFKDDEGERVFPEGELTFDAAISSASNGSVPKIYVTQMGGRSDVYRLRIFLESNQEDSADDAIDLNWVKAVRITGACGDVHFSGISRVRILD